MKWSTIYSALLLVAVAVTAVYSSATAQTYGTEEGKHFVLIFVCTCNLIPVMGLTGVVSFPVSVTPYIEKLQLSCLHSVL